MALIACVGLDPLVAGLVRRVRPNDTVVEVGLDQMLSARRTRYAAVVMRATEEGLALVRGTPLAPRVVLVARAREAFDLVDHPGPVVRRPVDPTELRLALARVAPTGRIARLRRRVATATAATSTDGIFAVARVGAVTAASALALTNVSQTASSVLVILVVVWAAVRVAVRQSTPVMVGLDAVVALGVVLMTDGTGSPFLLLAAVVAAEVGYALRPATGAALVAAGTVAGLVPLGVQLSRGDVEAIYLVAWGTLIPLASTIGVLGGRMRQSRESGTVRALSELHATLDRLARQAQGVAGTLESSSVAERVLETLRTELGVSAAVLMVGDAPVRDVVAAMGLAGPAPARLVVTDGGSPKVPDALQQLLPSGELRTVPLRVSGVDRGAITVVIPPPWATRDADVALRDIAREAALALDNARLFEGIRAMTVDDERRRLARDLHDGVIQSLVHVGFELDLVERALDGDSAQEVARLREVVGRTVDEVRSTVNDLRSVRLSAGLGTGLQSLARDYAREGLTIATDLAPIEDLPPEAEVQLFRIAQEAVSNAVHHGQPSTILLRLWESESGVHLQVLDDGVGLQATPATNTAVGDGRGVGLRAMQERVDLLGARLDLGPGDSGRGTCVQVDLPRERASS